MVPFFPCIYRGPYDFLPIDPSPGEHDNIRRHTMSTDIVSVVTSDSRLAVRKYTRLAREDFSHQPCQDEVSQVTLAIILDDLLVGKTSSLNG